AREDLFRQHGFTS
ncbi:mscS Mechanosensitive ion channel domain protein, partial [Vibrio harveyi]